MTLTTILFIIAGGICLIIAALIKDEKKEENNTDADAIEMLLNKSVEEADSAMNELNGLSEEVFKEFEEKYNELLFLYQMIEDKKSENSVDTKVSAKNRKRRFRYSNPKLQEIKSLAKEGLSVAEIAKKLNIGQGEVQLIMQLGKDSGK
ncbi:MAG: hypothetical protein IJ583_14985 [Firmicutes bacterium]|nr:hypothetical protein [Bacillota bacterium]